jgi:poly(A) polymerase
MLLSPTRLEAVRTLERLGLDAPILNEPHTDSTGQSLLGLGESDDPTAFAAALAAWACDRGLSLDQTSIASLIQRWRSGLCLSNQDSDALQSSLAALATIEHGWPELSIAAKKRLAGAHPGYIPAIRVMKGRNPQLEAAVRSEVEQLSRTPSGLCPEPFVTGDDLIAIGLTPGPSFKTHLDALYDAQLEGRVKTRAEALELSRRLGI